MKYEKDLVGNLMDRLGGPKRYAYRISPVMMNVMQDDGSFVSEQRFLVDFELACDRMDIHDIHPGNCIWNPHVLNMIEPGLDGTEIGAYVSHGTVLDAESCSLLVLHSSREGCRTYDGVVMGYSVHDLEQVLPDDVRLLDTGLFLSDDFVAVGGLSVPDGPFDENAHQRFVQASESYRCRMNRKRKDTEIAAHRELFVPSYRHLESEDMSYGFA